MLAGSTKRAGAKNRGDRSVALPGNTGPVHSRLRDSFQRAVQAHKREEEALEELRVLIYAEETAADPQILSGALEISRVAASGLSPEDALTPEQFVAQARVRRGG